MMENDEEMARVRALPGVEIRQGVNGLGQPFGDLRAWPGGLAVVRGVGDGDCGEVVSCVPSCKTVPLPPMGGSIVLASDGVWDGVSYSAAAALLRRESQKKRKSGPCAATAKQVVDLALNRVSCGGRRDAPRGHLRYHRGAARPHLHPVPPLLHSQAGMMDDISAIVLFCPALREFEATGPGTPKIEVASLTRP